jgi:XTP/dITP diphosphohydrolase
MAEFEQMLRNCAVRILPMGTIDMPDAEETGKTFLENAKIKAEAARLLVPKKVATMGDDSGLCIDALSGGPGIYSSRYAEGDYSKAMDRILAKLSWVGDGERGAHFSCVLHVIAPDGSRHIFEESVEGVIASERRGKGFGYSPIFIANGHSKTFGEMSMEEKNKISPRGLAVKKFIRWLELFGAAWESSPPRG